MPSNTPAFWSAIAAMFAAFTSLLAYVTMRRSLLDSARPEIVLEDWDRQEGGERDISPDKITYKTIRNHGVGSAYHLYAVATDLRADPPTVFTSRMRIPILAPNEEREIDGIIWLVWDNVSPRANGGPKYLPISLQISCLDSKGRRHKTTYWLMAFELSPTSVVADEFAPGVMLTSRTTVIRPVWWLKLMAKRDKVLKFLNKVRHWKPGAKT